MALLTALTAHAKIFRVNYPGTPLTGVDYADLQSAHDVASAGDTIQIYGNESGFTNISKMIVLLGFGYNFDVHPNLQAVGGDAPSKTSSISFEAGSDGSIVKGVDCFVRILSTSGAPLSNITFERCRFTNFQLVNGTSYGAISDIKIIGCEFTSTNPIYALNFNQNPGKPVTNLLIDNCILIGCTIYNSGTTVTIENCVSPTNSSYVFNFNDAGVIVKNCILWDRLSSSNNTNTVYENNFFHEAQPGTLPAGSTNNRWSQDWGTIFNRLGGTSDNPGDPGDVAFDENYYILKSGSPAINGGEDASNNPTDCGIFGGEPANKYVISGVPPIPSIYQLSATLSSGSASPYNITISARGNN